MDCTEVSERFYMFSLSAVQFVTDQDKASHTKQWLLVWTTAYTRQRSVMEWIHTTWEKDQHWRRGKILPKVYRIQWSKEVTLSLKSVERKHLCRIAQCLEQSECDEYSYRWGKNETANLYHFPRSFFFRTLPNKVGSIKFPNFKSLNSQIWMNNELASLWPGTWI